MLDVMTLTANCHNIMLELLPQYDLPNSVVTATKYCTCVMMQRASLF